MSLSKSLALIRDRVCELGFSASELLYHLRRGAGLTQRRLARRAGTRQERVAEYENGKRVPSHDRMCELLAATGHRLVAVPTDATAAYETAGRIADILDDDPTPSGYERSLALLVDLSFTLAEQDGPVRVALCVTRPPPTGDARFDAGIAALVEHRMEADGLPVPSWVLDDDRYLVNLWEPDPDARPVTGAFLLPFLRRRILVSEKFVDDPMK